MKASERDRHAARETLRKVGQLAMDVAGRSLSDQADNSHLPFGSWRAGHALFGANGNLQKVAAVHSPMHDCLNSVKPLVIRQTYKQARTAGPAEWRRFCAA